MSNVFYFWQQVEPFSGCGQHKSMFCSGSQQTDLFAGGVQHGLEGAFIFLSNFIFSKDGHSIVSMIYKVWVKIYFKEVFGEKC